MSTPRIVRFARMASVRSARSVWEEPPDDETRDGPIEATGNDHFNWPDWDQGREADACAASQAEDGWIAGRDRQASQ